jgi:hypothetical protein
MRNLIIEAVPNSPYYPEVVMDGETGVCEIRGESYMEEAYKFYLPLLKWLKDFTLEEKKPVILNIKLTYFNTNSSRLLLDILDILKKYVDIGGLVTVNWYYEPDDPDVLEEVEDFKIETGLNINLQPLQ